MIRSTGNWAINFVDFAYRKKAVVQAAFFFVAPKSQARPGGAPLSSFHPLSIHKLNTCFNRSWSVS
jgi:hypothetical protein